MKLTILLLTLSICTISAQNTVQNAIDQFVQFPPFGNASISVQVQDISNRQVIGSYNPNLSLPPASTVKLFSTATALEVLTPNYQPKTRIYTNGLVVDSVLRGDLIIRGGGDPSLGSRFFCEEGKEDEFIDRLLENIRNKGISSFTGVLIIDGSSFSYNGVPDGWSWGDMGNYYGAGPSGICLYDNMLRYYFSTKSLGQVSQLTRTYPVVPELQFYNQVTAGNGSGDNSYIYGGPYSYERFGTGSLPSNRKEFMVKGSLPDPEWQLGQEILLKAQTKGWNWKNQVQIGRKILARNEKLPNYEGCTLIDEISGSSIQELVFQTNQKSINFFAEQLLCLVALQKGKIASTENGLDELEKYWRDKLNLSGLYLKDGSGLSRSNAVSSSHYCALLQAMTTSKNYAVFRNSLPIAGQSGTIAGMCRGQAADGRVVAKSGTMNKIKSYAGYVKTKSGKELCFAVVINNFTCSTSTAVDQIEKLFNAMANY